MHELRSIDESSHACRVSNGRKVFACSILQAPSAGARTTTATGGGAPRPWTAPSPAAASGRPRAQPVQEFKVIVTCFVSKIDWGFASLDSTVAWQLLGIVHKHSLHVI